MDDLEALRAKRLAELQMRQQQQSYGNDYQEQMQKQVETEAQIKQIVKKLLDTSAQSRLTNLRLANPDFARQVEILLIQLYQSGRLAKLTDEQFKNLLLKINEGRRDIKIEKK